MSEISQLIFELQAENAVLRAGAIKSSNEIEQILGKALGYPWYKDDQKNFPGATEADGVCVGDHVPESLAAEAADRIAALSEELEELGKSYDSLVNTAGEYQDKWAAAQEQLKTTKAELKHIHSAASAHTQRLLDRLQAAQEQIEVLKVQLSDVLDLPYKTQRKGAHHDE